MEPSSESTKLEGEGQAYEYLAAGKLNGCKALITGGESVTVALILIKNTVDVNMERVVPGSAVLSPSSTHARVPTSASSIYPRSRPTPRIPRKWWRRKAVSAF